MNTATGLYMTGCGIILQGDIIMDFDLSFFEMLFLIAIAGSDMLVLELLHKRNAKKCKYDCSKCRNWDCMIDYCNRKREELKK